MHLWRQRAARFLTMAFCAFLAGCGVRKPADQLTVGMELAYPPFEMTDPEGVPTGVSVDLAQALGKALGRKVIIENIPFDGLIPALKTGKIDLIISSMTATEERARSIAFSEPYLQTGLCLLVGKLTDLRSLQEADQPGKTIAVKQGTTGQIYASRHIHKAKVLVLDSEAACVLEVVQGKTDAFIYDQMSVYKNWQKNQRHTVPLLRPFQKESWAIGVRRDNEGLLEAVNAFLYQFRAQSGFEALGEKYLKEQKEAFRKMGLPFYF